MSKMGAANFQLQQRIDEIESAIYEEYRNAMQFKKTSKVIQLNDRAAEVDERLKNIALLQGQYQFKFGPSTVSLKDKLSKITGEPIAYHLYKRRDMESKIDKLAIEQLRLAKLIFTVTQTARKERHDYLVYQRKKELEDAAAL